MSGVADGGGGAMVTGERRGRLAIVRFCNPPTGWIPTRGATALADTIRPLLADPGIGAIILTGGQPHVFIRHADVGSIARSARAMQEGRISVEDFAQNPFIDLCALLDRADKPVIAAIDGVCMGGGLEIALACTMRIAGAKATTIGLPEIRLDITPGGGGIPRLARVVGPHRARLLALCGTLVDAAMAARLGIVDECVDDAFARAVEWGERFACRHPAAIAAIMRGADSGASPQDSSRAFARVVALPEVLARVERFLAEGERLDELE